MFNVDFVFIIVKRRLIDVILPFEDFTVVKELCGTCVVVIASGYFLLRRIAKSRICENVTGFCKSKSA
jgi:hypothetical protein